MFLISMSLHFCLQVFRLRLLPTTVLGTKPALLMAAFSSQWPNTVTPQILKVQKIFSAHDAYKFFHSFLELDQWMIVLCQPDITAPGVSILVAFTGLAFDDRHVLFNSESGTFLSFCILHVGEHRAPPGDAYDPCRAPWESGPLRPPASRS
jgi:hypothetical protein